MPNLNNSMLRLARYDWENYRICHYEIAGKIPEVVKRVANSWKYQVKLLFARARGWNDLAILKLRGNKLKS